MELRLFSEDDNIVSYRLFSDEDDDINKSYDFSNIPETVKSAGLKKVRCRDCKYEFVTGATTSSLICPKCGGDRVNVVNDTNHAEYEVNMISSVDPFENSRRLFLDKEQAERDFQREFSEPNDLYELNLKRKAGESFDAASAEKLFGISADEMIERGFADNLGDGIRVSDDAFLKSKLFSKLIISVTKVLDLDPKITMCGNLEDPLEKKMEIIDELENRGNLTPKGIILIRRAHNIIPEDVVSKDGIIIPDHSKEDEINSWADDSGILNDLHLEFGGSNQDLGGFKKILSERYSDAPTNLIDLLSNRGIIRLNGSQVRIL